MSDRLPGLAVAALVMVLLAGCSRGGSAQQASTATKTPETTRTAAATGTPTATVEATITSNGKSAVAVVVKSSAGLSTMQELLAASGLGGPLAGKSTYTLFAPTNAAFDKLPPGFLDKLKQPADIEKLRTLLRYHLVKGKVPTSQMVNIKRVMTFQGGILQASEKNAKVLLNGNVVVVQHDIAASNGYVDTIDTVLVPKGFTP
jgi:uncharacterized surface protein with fasciclin (FAS1) repeats